MPISNGGQGSFDVSALTSKADIQTVNALADIAAPIAGKFYSETSTESLWFCTSVSGSVATFKESTWHKIGTSSVLDAAITEAKLDSGVQTKLNAVGGGSSNAPLIVASGFGNAPVSSVTVNAPITPIAPIAAANLTAGTRIRIQARLAHVGTSQIPRFGIRFGTSESGTLVTVASESDFLMDAVVTILSSSSQSYFVRVARLGGTNIYQINGIFSETIAGTLGLSVTGYFNAVSTTDTMQVVSYTVEILKPI